MKWIFSQGGPLVMCSPSTARLWDGIANDYSRACEVSDFAGVVDKDEAQYLVLNDEPLQTTVITLGHENHLIRWRYAPSESALHQAFSRWSSSSKQEPCETLTFFSNETKLVLFDSALTYSDSVECLAFEIKDSIREVHTFNVEAADVSFLVHSLV